MTSYATKLISIHPMHMMWLETSWCLYDRWEGKLTMSTGRMGQFLVESRRS